MSHRIIQGSAFHCGDFVDTDVMSPGRFEPYEGKEQLARIALIDYPSDTPFVDRETGRSPFKIIVAGDEFGCGSSRETAPQALRYAGAEVVIARSFARIFFRNCVNMGFLIPIKYPHSFDASITGKQIQVDLDELAFYCDEKRYPFQGFGPLTGIVEAGGLTNYTKRKLAERQSSEPSSARQP